MGGKHGRSFDIPGMKSVSCLGFPHHVFRVGNQDTLKVAAAVKKWIAEEAPRIFPENVTLEIWKDDSIFLQAA